MTAREKREPEIQEHRLADLMSSHGEGKGDRWSPLSEGGQIWYLEEFCVLAVARMEVLTASDGEGPAIPAI